MYDIRFTAAWLELVCDDVELLPRSRRARSHAPYQAAEAEPRLGLNQTKFRVSQEGCRGKLKLGLQFGRPSVVVGKNCRVSGWVRAGPTIEKFKI